MQQTSCSLLLMFCVSEAKKQADEGFYVWDGYFVGFVGYILFLSRLK